MKKGLTIIVCLLAAVFLISSIDNGYAKVKGDKKILKDLKSNVLGKAIPAIRKVENKKMKRKKNLRRAKRILIQLVKNKRKHPEIRIAAANALATLKVRKAKGVLRRQIRIERNARVKKEFRIAYNRLVGKVRLKPSYPGTPAYRGTPGYHGTPGYYGTPGYHGTPGYYGTP